MCTSFSQWEMPQKSHGCPHRWVFFGYLKKSFPCSINFYNSGIFPHKCDICNKGYNFQFALKKHLERHEKEINGDIHQRRKIIKSSEGDNDSITDDNDSDDDEESDECVEDEILNE